MTELIKFHKHVESILEKLTDETQVNITEKVCYFHYASTSISISSWPVFLCIAGACKVWRFPSKKAGSIKDSSCPRLKVEWRSVWTEKLEGRASIRPASWQDRTLLQQGNFVIVLNLIVRQSFIICKIFYMQLKELITYRSKETLTPWRGQKMKNPRNFKVTTSTSTSIFLYKSRNQWWMFLRAAWNWHSR